MEKDRQKIANLKTFLRLLVITPVIYFGTFGDNKICINFIYFFNFYVSLVLIAFLFSSEKLLENLKKDDIPNEYLYFVSWILPVVLFIADGWILSGILWFFTWSVARSKFLDFLKENDKQDNDT
jgi:hypothetical protein